MRKQTNDKRTKLRDLTGKAPQERAVHAEDLRLVAGGLQRGGTCTFCNDIDC